MVALISEMKKGFGWLKMCISASMPWGLVLIGGVVDEGSQSHLICDCLRLGLMGCGL